MSNNDSVIYTGEFNDRTLCIRRATPADYDDIIRINDDVYAGIDYVPYTYHETMGDPAAHSFLAEVDGQVVSYVCYWVCGEGKSMTLGTAGRMYSKYQHQRLNTLFGDVAREEMKRLYPNLQYNFGNAISNDLMLKRTEQANGRRVHILNSICGGMPPEHLQMATESDCTSVACNTKVEAPSLSRTLELLCDDDVLQFLYPKGYMFIADRWMAAPATKYEVRRQIRKMDIYVSGSLSSGDLAVSNAFATLCPLGLTLVLVYSGYPDVNTIMAHILKAARQYAVTSGLTAGKQSDHSASGPDKKNPLVTLSIVFPETIEREPIIDFVKRTFQCDVRENFFPKVALYETPYKSKI